MVLKNIGRLTSNLNKLSIYTFKRKMSSMQDDVTFEEIKNKGIITLNRPKALNSLNISMIDKLLPQLKKWESEKSLVIVKGAGEKAFCAGGDVRVIVVAARNGDKSLGTEFFKKEYTTNGLIGSYKIPYIAFIDGIVMGGGVGLSVHGHYRIATERTVFAMPETQIGLFPDVGGSYFLPRLQGRLGLYLALTGYRLTGSDVLKAGIATHYCESKNLDEIQQKLIDNCNTNEDIRNVLQKFNANVDKDFSLAPVMEKINKCFDAKTIEDIIKNLESDGSSWAHETIKSLKQMSPTSLKITIKELELGAKMSLLECLQMEYRLGVSCVEGHDFSEGVRALLIDKDKKPIWKPATLAEVTDQIVEDHFKRLPEDKELVHKL